MWSHILANHPCDEVQEMVALQNMTKRKVTELIQEARKRASYAELFKKTDTKLH